MPRKQRKKRVQQRISTIKKRNSSTPPKKRINWFILFFTGVLLLSLLFLVWSNSIQKEIGRPELKSVSINKSEDSVGIDSTKVLDILKVVRYEPLRYWSWHNFFRDYERLGDHEKSAANLYQLFPDTVFHSSVRLSSDKYDTVQVGILSIPVSKGLNQGKSQTGGALRFHEFIPDLYYDDLEMRIMTTLHPWEIETPILFKPYFEHWNHFIDQDNPFYEDLFRVHRYPNIELPLEDLAATEKVLVEILTSSLLIEAWEKAFKASFDLFLIKLYQRDFKGGAYYGTGAFALAKTIPEIQSSKVMCDLVHVYFAFMKAKDIPLSVELRELIYLFLPHEANLDTDYATFIEKRLVLAYEEWLEVSDSLASSSVNKRDSLLELEQVLLQGIVDQAKWLMNLKNEPPKYYNQVLEKLPMWTKYTQSPDLAFLYAHANRRMADQYMGGMQFQHAERLLLIAYKHMSLCETENQRELDELEASFQFLKSKIFESSILREIQRIRDGQQFQRYNGAYSTAETKRKINGSNEEIKKGVETYILIKTYPMFQALNNGDNDLARKLAFEISNSYFSISDTTNAQLFLDLGLDLEERQSAISVQRREQAFSWHNFYNNISITHLLFENYHDQKTPENLSLYVQRKRYVDSLVCIVLSDQNKSGIQQSLLTSITASSLIYESLDMGKHFAEVFFDDSFLKDQIALQHSLIQEGIEQRKNFREKVYLANDTASFQNYFNLFIEERKLLDRVNESNSSFYDWENQIGKMSRVEQDMDMLGISDSLFEHKVTSATIDSIQTELQIDEVVLIFASNQTIAYRCAIFPDTVIYYDHFHLERTHFYDIDYTTKYSLREYIAQLISKNGFSVRHARWLYSFLFNRLEDRLHGKKLIISSQGIFENLPFEALVCDTSRIGAPVFLIERHPVRYIYSLRDVFPSQEESTELPFHVFIPYDEKDKNQLFHNQKVINELPNYGAKVNAGNQIRKSELFNVLSDSGICHIAAHGIVHNKVPELGYLLNSSDSSERFLGVELLGFSGVANLVYLNVCNSGTGVFESGKGLHSFGKEFYLSGARSVIQSPIPLDDEASAEITSLFYEHLASGLSKSESLRLAKLSYLKNAPNHRRAPYFWAGSMFYGQDGKVILPQSSLTDWSAFQRWFGWLAGLLVLVLGLGGFFRLRKLQS